MRPLYLISGILLAGLAVSAGIIAVQERPMEVLTGKRPFVEIANPSGFVNTEPFALADIVGKKVILVDFMTYSCINCQRTFPHLVAWYSRYKVAGLEIVGIHTPEFAFEKDTSNVEEAMREAGITWPIVLDNEYGTWRAYGNNYWPRKYLIDIHGNIVYDHIGEGAYEETEAKIRELLAERAEVLGEKIALPETLASAAIEHPANAARSPETYFGSLRNELFGSGRPGETGVGTFTAPEEPRRNTLYLEGKWDVQPEYAESHGGTIVYRYNARNVFLVASSERPVRIRILQDGSPASSSRGADVDADGYVSIEKDTLYSIIENAAAGEHVLEIEAPGGVRAFAFTFG